MRISASLICGVIRPQAPSFFRGRSMKVSRQERAAKGIRFSVSGDSGEVARAYLYMMTNDLHAAPFGLLEDVFVEESQRGSGVGSALVKEVIAAAREAGCYKLIATSRTSRPKVHELYERLGFEKHGLEFRISF
jgi:GNAT superfamily N-acetyltransferase